MIRSLDIKETDNHQAFYYKRNIMPVKKLITTKVGMTSSIDENGAFKAITLLKYDDHQVVSIKTTDNDGYDALVVGISKAKKLPKSILGQVKNSKIMPKMLKEFRLSNKDDSSDINVGSQITADVFSVGEKVHVRGLTKGKGWAGTIKRHNFHRGRKTHGGRSYRRVGSIGSMYPQHIFKGKKMAGQMGHTNVTIKNLEVALIDLDQRVIGLYGAVPGPRKGLIEIRGLK